VIGGVRIGSRVRIGANAVVLEDVPDGATVVGVAARVVRTEPPPGQAGPGAT
jgi:serine O-acetyltransferase